MAAVFAISPAHAARLPGAPAADPPSQISSVIDERASRRDEAVFEVTDKWGGEQQLTGPVLVVPYKHRWSETNSQGVVIPHSDVRRAYFLPERLDVTGKIDAEERARGIFSVQVYALDLALRGAFARPDFAALGISAEDADWSKAEVAVGISDVRAIQSTPSLSWAGEERPFVPGAEAGGLAENGIHVDVPLGPTGREIEFAFPLRLHGSEGVWFVPLRARPRSRSSRPGRASFQGSWLPTRREVSAAGFSAGWSTP